MNFDLNEEQEVIRDLAEQVFAGQSTVERVKALADRLAERVGARFERSVEADWPRDRLEVAPL